MAQAPGSPVPHEVSTELERVVERWRQLPVDRALSYAGRVRELVQSLADRVAEVGGVRASAVPDLGPATLMDQLTVLVYDASAASDASAADDAAGSSTAATSTASAASRASSAVTPSASTALTSALADDLASLRRELR